MFYDKIIASSKTNDQLSVQMTSQWPSSLPGLVEHFSLSQFPGSETGSDKEHEHAGDHEVLKVVLDQVEALAGGDPRPIEVEPVGEHQDS